MSKYRRKSGIRSHALYVIACEGAVTEVDYFNKLKGKLRSTRLKIEVVEREETGHSSWGSVISMLDQAKRKKHYLNSDKFYVVVDFDRQNHTQKNKSRAATECSTKGYNLIVSNPCIEYWFLLHFISPDELSTTEKQEIFENQDGFMKSFLRQKAGNYNPLNINIDQYFPLTEHAVLNAKNSEEDPSRPWPEGIGTRMYKLVEEILDIERTTTAAN